MTTVLQDSQDAAEQAERADRTNRLRNLMAEHKLNSLEVGAILKRSPQTVRSWMSVAYEDRAIPERILRLLELELKQKQRTAPKGSK